MNSKDLDNRMRLNALAAQRGDATDTNTTAGNDPAQVH